MSGSLHHRPSSGTLAAVFALAAGIGACTGEITDPGAAPGAVQPGGKSSGLCAAGAAPLRRLTRTEYDNTVRDLLGDASKPASAFPEDETLTGFASGASVSPLLAELYMTTAEQLAQTAVSKLSTLMACDPKASGEDACVREFIRDFGKRAFRRPLTNTEIDELFAVYAAERKIESFDASVELLIAAFLQSPRFLYRPELGAVSGATTTRVPLSSHEVASRLSYFLWQTMPDDELFALADAGELESAEVVADQARRMLSDQRAKDGVLEFFGQWFHLNQLDNITKSATAYPDFDAATAAAMKEETRRFLEDLMWEGDGRIGTLLTASHTFVNADLAPLYGVTPPSGSGFVRVTLDPTVRAGVLTHPGMMTIWSGAEQSSPVLRGLFVREAFLCQTPPPPPENLVVVPPDPDPSSSTRDKYLQHMKDPACKQCHTLMDPLGFAFEHFDAVGKYRTKDNGFPVDAKGEVLETLDADGPFEGAVELGAKLAQSRQVKECVARQWFRFAVGRPDQDEDACSLSKVYDALEAADGDMREAVVAIVKTEAFRSRTPITGGTP